MATIPPGWWDAPPSPEEQALIDAVKHETQRLRAAGRLPPPPGDPGSTFDLTFEPPPLEETTRDVDAIRKRSARQIARRMLGQEPEPS